MDEVENQMAVEEIAPPETSPQEVSTDRAVDNGKEENLRALRNGKKEAERKAHELERQLQIQREMFSAVLQQSQAQVRQEPDELDSISSEDYISKGKVEKLVDKKVKNVDQMVEEKVQKVLAERERSLFAERLRSKYADFDDVVNPDTLDLFEQQEPELAGIVAKNTDPYGMALQTYKYIKTMGILEKVPNQRRANEVEKKLEKNSKSVQTPQAFEKRPMAQVFQYTDQQLKELNQEMNRYAAMAGGVPELR